MYILKRKDPTEFNGIESFVASSLTDEDISWIPLKSSISLKKVEVEKDNLEAKFQAIEEEVSKIEARYSKVAKALVS